MDLTTLALLVVGLVGGLALVESVVRRTDVGAGLVLALLIVQEFLDVDLTFGVGPFNVHADDLAIVVLTVGAIARLLRTERPSVGQRLLIGLGVLVLWSVVRGVDVVGLTSAINESRKFFGFVAAGLYFASIEPRADVLERIGRLWLWAAAALCLLTAVRWGGNLVGVTEGMFGGGGRFRSAIPSDAALVVGQAALLTIPAMRDRSAGWMRYATPVLLVFVVLLQHRTVWIVVATGLLVLLFRERALTVTSVAAFAAGLVVVGAVLFVAFDVGDDPLVTELADSSTRTGTFEWRVAGWEALLADSGPESAEEAALGRPFGSGWVRSFEGIVVDVSPHNFYVEVFLRLGVVGTAGLLGLYAVSLRGRRGPRLPAAVTTSTLSSRNVLTTLVGGQLVYYVTYTPDMAQAMLLGLACSVAAHRWRSPVRPPSAPVAATP